jgi:hypothetical protein
MRTSPREPICLVTPAANSSALGDDSPPATRVLIPGTSAPTLGRPVPPLASNQLNSVVSASSVRIKDGALGSTLIAGPRYWNW